tara:strand:- start:58 stop:1341 length:1284 start_codon:yes stop_codon:yes gene_type:complete
MKLHYYTSRIQVFWFLGLFGFFSILFYLVLSWNVNLNADETLYNRKVHLLEFLDENPQLPFTEDNPLDDFSFEVLSPGSFVEGYERFTDTLIYESVDDEFDEYRKLTAHTRLHGIDYKLELTKPMLEAEEIIASIAITLTGLFLGLTFAFYLSQRIIARKIWTPFFTLLDQLRNYRIDSGSPPDFADSPIEEFQKLQDSLRVLISKNAEVFESQKQFIANASHEMQTPLSVIQSRLEELISQTSLTAEQSTTLEAIIRSTQRLKKLNKTLLLLAKIENKQFLSKKPLQLKEIILRSLEYYDEMKDGKNIRVHLLLNDHPVFSANPTLTEILIQNLLKNAFVHNRKDGLVKIALKWPRLTIQNTGPLSQLNLSKLDSDRLFDRFYKNSENPDTWGLGLAISQKIVQVSGWELLYREANGVHEFEMVFG